MYVWCMFGVCWVYVGCMLGVCWVYVGCMLGVCWVYVGCMLGVCWMNVECQQHKYINIVIQTMKHYKGTLGKHIYNRDIKVNIIIY